MAVQHSFQPHTIAKICDYVAEGKDEADQSKRRERMANKHDVSVETIRAITAHIDIRKDMVLNRVGGILQKRKTRLTRADEGFELLEKVDGESAPRVNRKLRVQERKLEAAQQAYALMAKGEIREAIKAFGKAGEAEILEEIASVYAKQRPDIAAEALMAANSIDGALELAALQLRAGNRRSAREVLGNL